MARHAAPSVAMRAARFVRGEILHSSTPNEREELGLARTLSVRRVDDRYVVDIRITPSELNGADGSVVVHRILALDSLRELAIGRVTFDRVPVEAHTVASAKRMRDVEELVLASNGLTKDALSPLFDGAPLARCRALTIAGNPLGIEGARALAGATGLPALRSLELRAVGLPEEGAAELGESTSLELEQLVLVEPEIYLSPAQWKKVLVDGKDMSAGRPYSAYAFERLLRGALGARLERLSIVRHVLGHESVGVIVDAATGGALRSVSLSSVGLDEQAFRAIIAPAAPTKLRALALHAAIFEPGAAATRNGAIRGLLERGLALLGDAQGHPELESLDLARTPIGSAGAEKLSLPALGKLRTLGLEATAIDDRGVSSLDLSRVERLDLAKNTVTAASAEAIAARAGELRSLDIRDNPIRDAGVSAIARAKGLAKLTRLIVSGARVGDDGARSIADSETLVSLARLGMSGGLLTDEGARSLFLGPRGDALTHVALADHYLTGVFAAFVTARSHPSLVHLELGSNAIDAESVAHLAASPALERVELPGVAGQTPGKRHPDALRFDVLVVALGDRRVAVIRALADQFSGDLAKAKVAVETLPIAVATATTKADADALFARFTAAGARVELRATS